MTMGSWKVLIAGVILISYSFSLRSTWRRYKAQGTAWARPDSQRLPKIEAGLRMLNDAKVVRYGPGWPLVLGLGLGLLAWYFVHLG